MKPESAVTSFLPTAEHYVYILPLQDGSRLKIGRSVDPLDRITGLMNIYPDIDLSRAAILAVDTPRIETVLHSVFEPRRLTLPERTDGYTEWFSGNFVDEALAFAQQVAVQRGIEYPVYRQVDTLLQAYRTCHPHAGQRAPRLTKHERQARLPVIEARLREMIIEQTHRFLDVLWERPFDHIVRFEGRSFLARGVWRGEEPECWHPDRGARGSDWGQQLAQKARITARVDDSSALFGLIGHPIFAATTDQEGREYFEVCKATSLPSDSTHGRELPDAVAFAILKDAIRDLPVIAAHRDALAGPQSAQHASWEPR